MNETLRKVGEKIATMKIKDAFEPFFIWQEKMGMTPKTIKNDRYYLGAIVHSIQDIEVMDLKKTDVSKVIEAGGRAASTGRSGRRHAPEAPAVPEGIRPSRSRSAGRTSKIPTVSQKKVEYLTEDELEADSRRA
jgi:hypothetical protein